MPFDMDISWIQYPARWQRAGVLGLFLIMFILPIPYHRKKVFNRNGH